MIQTPFLTYFMHRLTQANLCAFFRIDLFCSLWLCSRHSHRCGLCGQTFRLAHFNCSIYLQFYSESVHVAISFYKCNSLHDYSGNKWSEPVVEMHFMSTNRQSTNKSKNRSQMRIVTFCSGQELQKKTASISIKFIFLNEDTQRYQCFVKFRLSLRITGVPCSDLNDVNYLYYYSYPLSNLTDY